MRFFVFNIRKERAVRIAIQGRKGSYHEKAAKIYFDYVKPNVTYLDRFDDVFEMIDNSLVDFGLVALANNRYGFIPEVYKTLLEGKYYINGEIVISIQHQLLGLDSGIDLHKINEIHSQAPAIGQCQLFLNKYLPQAKIIEQRDTAFSAQLVSQQTDPHIVAIASREAAVITGLSIVKDNIQDDKNNLTRFIIIGSDPPKLDISNKTSLILELKNKTGGLSDVLLKIKNADINIDLLHSSFIANSDFNMKFFIEINEGSTQKLFELLRRLEHDLGCKVSNLGSYKSA